jgi:hypothetical protein
MTHSYIGGIDQQPSFTLEGYPLYEVENVSLITIENTPNYGWDVRHDPSVSGDINEYYLYIDGYYDEGFSHWVFESSFYLPMVSKLREFYPNLKILSFRKKGYKDCIYKAFDLTENDIVYEIKEKRNKVFFFQGSSLADHTKDDLYMRHVYRYYHSLISKCGPIQKDISVLYLPRGKKENLAGTDRVIPFQNEILEMIKSIENSYVYYTDSTTNFIDQIRVVRKASVIILDYGSSLLVNGFFAEGSKILVLGDSTLHLQNLRPLLLLKDSIRRKNDYYYTPNGMSSYLIFHKLRSIIEGRESVSKHRSYCWRKCDACKSHEEEF